MPEIDFLDFDGVLKESVDAKGEAFRKLFAEFGAEIAARVERHHRDHGGMSRFEKMPLYLSWAGQSTDRTSVDLWCRRFSEQAYEAVITAPWVAGAVEFLAQSRNGLRVVVSAIPQEELERILEALGIRDCFDAVHGAPTSKAAAVAHMLRSARVAPERCRFVGDAMADHDAASVNCVPFVLRRHAGNQNLLPGYTGRVIQDLSEL